MSAIASATKRTLQFIRVIDVIDPIQERYRGNIVVADITLEKIVEHTGRRLPQVTIAERQLSLCLEE